MPIYEYRCQACGEKLELLVTGGQRPACPYCGSPALDKLISAPVVLSGQTARPAGQTCCGRQERCSAPPCSTGGTCRHES